ncbi:MAG TPA: ABC transporter ATP-binding protein [Rhabdochlamydiaceae bacterium]|jgi:ABC-2 type transport system ATP-binding protein|nr:ABC transporter ATP-binding protein [Rhabdochlamydiaceae bacterium]
MKKLFLQINQVTKTYFDGRRILKKALQGISLELYQGEVLGLLGVNGAGKTTLVSILATLHPPTTGEILWNGISIYDVLLPFRSVVGYCPQHPNIEKDFSLGESLVISGQCYGLSKKEAEERKKELAKDFNLEPYLDASIDQVSGGYKQRFLIARALMHRPHLVILDEPTVGLDSHIRRELWGVISSLREQGITVILTTHYLDEAEKLSDRICLIHEGIVRITDTPENLKNQHQKNSLEEVFLKFIDDPNAEIFNGGT